MSRRMDDGRYDIEKRFPEYPPEWDEPDEPLDEFEPEPEEPDPMECQVST